MDNDGITQPECEDQDATTSSGIRKDSTESSSTDSRHCAFCLKLCPVPAKLCSGCKRRTYCSRRCQVIDWKVGKNQIGQGHKNWCQKFEYGEEDIDWEVVPVPGKGLGIVAKKPMPSKYLIIVEPPISYPYHHPRIMDLHPEGATLEKKVQCNLLEADQRTRFRDHIALRISRLNHSCRPNAGIVYDDGAQCEILFAERDIQPGEEICVPYFSSFKAFLGSEDLKISCQTMGTFAAALQRKRYEFMMSEWGFVCPDDCFCRQSSTKKLLMKSRMLHVQTNHLKYEGKYYKALESIKQELKLQDELGCSWMSKADINQYAYEITRSAPIPARIPLKHVRKAYESYRVLCPYSSLVHQAEEDIKSASDKAAFDELARLFR